MYKQLSDNSLDSHLRGHGLLDGDRRRGPSPGRGRQTGVGNPFDGGHAGFGQLAIERPSFSHLGWTMGLAGFGPEVYHILTVIPESDFKLTVNG